MRRHWRDRGTLPEEMALGSRWGTLRIVGYEHGETSSVLTVCLCGAVADVAPNVLRHATTAGCAQCQPLPQLGDDMTIGQQWWDRLTIIGYERRSQGQGRWRYYVRCVCVCGGLASSRPYHLRRGNVTSCGCVRREQQRQVVHARWQEVRTGQRTLKVGRPRKSQEAAA